ncbi:MAG: hypothetical protein IJ851_03960 [Eubacterium sp.]|nr:hypothetical protein [Eubacterium sp.]
MQTFDSEIEEAKKRVRQMNEKANRFKDSTVLQSENTEKPKVQGEKDDSFFLILAIVMLLSKEKADNKIILALLYLLM